MGLWALKKTKLQKVGTIRTEILTPIYTAERRAKMSEAKMGKKRSAERRAKMSEAMKGKKRSADHKVLLIAPRASSTADASRPRCELRWTMEASVDLARLVVRCCIDDAAFSVSGSVRGLGAVSRGEGGAGGKGRTGAQRASSGDRGCALTLASR